MAFKTTKLLKPSINMKNKNEIYILSDKDESNLDAIERTMKELKDNPEELTYLLYHLDLIVVNRIPFWCASLRIFHEHFLTMYYHTFMVD